MRGVLHSRIPVDLQGLYWLATVAIAIMLFATLAIVPIVVVLATVVAASINVFIAIVFLIWGQFYAVQCHGRTYCL